MVAACPSPNLPFDVLPMLVSKITPSENRHILCQRSGGYLVASLPSKTIENCLSPNPRDWSIHEICNGYYCKARDARLLDGPCRALLKVVLHEELLHPTQPSRSRRVLRSTIVCAERGAVSKGACPSSITPIHGRKHTAAPTKYAWRRCSYGPVEHPDAGCQPAADRDRSFRMGSDAEVPYPRVARYASEAVHNEAPSRSRSLIKNCPASPRTGKPCH